MILSTITISGEPQQYSASAITDNLQNKPKGGMDYTNVAMTNQSNTFGGHNQTFDSGTLFIDAKNDRIGIGTINPSHKLEVNGNISAKGTVELGNDADLSDLTPAGAEKGFAEFSHRITDFKTPDKSGIYSKITFDYGNGMDSAYITGHQFITEIPGSVTKKLNSGIGTIIAYLSNTKGDVNSITGLIVESSTYSPTVISTGIAAHSFGYGTSTIDYNYGLSVLTGYQGTGDGIGSNYGIYIDSGSNPQSITNNYGLYIRDQDVGTNQNYAIYSEGGQSYFKDNIGINTKTPVQLLDVNGVMRMTPTDDPGDCDSNLKGSMYFDDSMSEPCYCNGSDWTQFDGGGTCS